MLGMSTGEVALIALVGFAAFGPKDVPVMARAVGRMAGRAVGFLFAARNRITSFADRTELTQLHMEVQEAMAQLETIRRDLRQGVSILHPPPPPPHPFPPSQATASSSSSPDSLHDPRPLIGTQDHSGKHEPLSAAFGLRRGSVLASEHEHEHDPPFLGQGYDQEHDHPPSLVDGRGPERMASAHQLRPPPSSLPFAARGALLGSNRGQNDPDLFADTGRGEPVWSARLEKVGEEGRARPAEIGAGARLPSAANVARAGTTATWRPTEWESSMHAHGNETGPSLPSPQTPMPADVIAMVRGGDRGTGGEEHVVWIQQQGWSPHEKQLQQPQQQQQQQQLQQEGQESLFILPVSAVAAGLAPKRAGPCSGSDILSDAMVEARVARQAQHFLEQQQQLQQQQQPLPTRPQGQAPE